MKPPAATHQDTPRRVPREAAKSPNPTAPQLRRQPPQRGEVAADPTCRYNRRTRRETPTKPQPRRRTSAPEGTQHRQGTSPSAPPFGADDADPLTSVYAARANALREAAPEAHNFDTDQRRPRCCSVQAAHQQEEPWHGKSLQDDLPSPPSQL